MTIMKEAESKTKFENIDVLSQHLVNIKHTADDVPPYITGMAVLHDGGVLLADDVHYSLLLLDKDFVIKESFNVTQGHERVRRPYDVALLDEIQAVVTCPGAELLQFITIHPNLQPGKTIALKDKHIWNVTVVCGKIYLTARWHPKPEILVLDRNGEILYVIDIKQIDSRIEDIRYIASNSVGTKLYLTCAGKVLSMTPDGQLVRSVSNAHMDQNVSGVALDSNENAYICCYNEHKVLVISADGTKSKTIDASAIGCRWPQSIGYRTADNVLVLGGFSSNLMILKLRHTS